MVHCRQFRGFHKIRYKVLKDPLQCQFSVLFFVIFIFFFNFNFWGFGILLQVNKKIMISQTYTTIFEQQQHVFRLIQLLLFDQYQLQQLLKLLFSTRGGIAIAGCSLLLNFPRDLFYVIYRLYWTLYVFPYGCGNIESMMFNVGSFIYTQCFFVEAQPIITMHVHEQPAISHPYNPS